MTSATINMEETTKHIFKTLMQKEGNRITKELSKKYGFDIDEGLRYLNLDNLEIINEEILTKSKNTTKSKPSKNSKTFTAKIPLPFCGKKFEGCCDAIRLNHGLYTQCTNEGSESVKDNSNGENTMLCKTCKKQVDNNTNNKPTYGYISDRIKLGDNFKDPKGKYPVNYGNVMKKLNITIDDVEIEALKHNISIPTNQLEVIVGKRGRPKKNELTKNNTEPVKHKGRGRPKKSAIVYDSSEDEDDKEDKDDKKDNEDDSESDAEEEQVIEIKIDGNMYLQSKNLTLYNIKTHEEIGRYDEETKKIIFEIDSDEE